MPIHKNVDKQFFGSEAPINRNSPLSVELEGPTGHPMKEFFGSQAPLSEMPMGVTQFDNHIREGQVQSIGSTVPINRTPNKGYESGTPMSHRAEAQSRPTKA